jgi:hypothetical protein
MQQSKTRSWMSRALSDMVLSSIAACEIARGSSIADRIDRR